MNWKDLWKFAPVMGLLAIAATSVCLHPAYVASSLRAEREVDALLDALSEEGRLCISSERAERLEQRRTSVASYLRNTRELHNREWRSLIEAIVVFAVLWMLIELFDLLRRQKQAGSTPPS